MLLNLSAGTLLAKCAAVAALRDAPHPADALVAAFPSLLLLGTDKLSQRWRFLRAAAGEGSGLPQGWPRRSGGALGLAVRATDPA
jgi:hypothetical protein